MSNETKRDVFLDAVDALADAQASGGNVGHQDANLFMAEYDDALPDDLPVIPELIGKYLIMRKHDRGDLVQALDEGTSFLLDGTQWESVQDWFWFSDVKDSVDTFARAWVLGVWRVEETGEIFKLEEEK
ncbi:hypothetical protein FAM4067_00308 [Lacticaseibacillus paracasei]|uniref:hypothetical protein n=1 Tax=Lacticaseibacillus paracasei TaxID=1597 RepID=UPI000FEE2084|nr:hypothetical protein [Lacticaseibacillus paracasei]RNE23237.1 hypothetical protein FAM4067_00308 [Lacticaseibacillus paracasei]